MSPRISISLLSAQSDQRLLALARDGHERAFEALVQRYRRPLLRYCRSMRLADARAEDVLQQAFLQVWLALARGAEVREVRPWLYRIVHNVAVNAIRAAGEPHGELTDAVQADAALARESNLERTIAVREALGEVAELPRMQRQAIFLTAVDGQTHDEVASTLGITEGALRGLLYRARATLRSAAAALTPPPLLEWAAGGGGAGPTAERLTEVTAGGGAAGIAGVLLKGAVVAVTAGALATGASVVVGDKSAARPQRAVQSDGASASSHAFAPTAPGEVLAAGAFGSIRLVADRSRAHRRGDDRRHGSKGAERRAHRSRGGSGSSGDSGSGSGELSASAQGRRGDTGTSGHDRGGGKSDDGSGSSSTSGSRERSGGSGREAASNGDGGGTSVDRSAGDGSTGVSGEQASGGSDSNSSGSGGGNESGLSVAPLIDSSTAPGSLSDESASDAEAASGGSARSSSAMPAPQRP